MVPASKCFSLVFVIANRVASKRERVYAYLVMRHAVAWLAQWFADMTNLILAPSHASSCFAFVGRTLSVPASCLLSHVAVHHDVDKHFLFLLWVRFPRRRALLWTQVSSPPTIIFVGNDIYLVVHVT